MYHSVVTTLFSLCKEKWLDSISVIYGLTQKKDDEHPSGNMLRTLTSEELATLAGLTIPKNNTQCLLDILMQGSLCYTEKLLYLNLQSGAFKSISEFKGIWVNSNVVKMDFVSHSFSCCQTAVIEEIFCLLCCWCLFLMTTGMKLIRVIK